MCPNGWTHARPNRQALEDSFVTASGRNVALRIYTQAHNADKTAFAMRSLKARALRCGTHPSHLGLFLASSHIFSLLVNACAHLLSRAPSAAQAAMKWDEERYGLEYDLDLFNVRRLFPFSTFCTRHCTDLCHSRVLSLCLPNLTCLPACRSWRWMTSTWAPWRTSR
jgi:hypothetical protein